MKKFNLHIHKSLTKNFNHFCKNHLSFFRCSLQITHYSFLKLHKYNSDRTAYNIIRLTGNITTLIILPFIFIRVDRKLENLFGQRLK